MEEVGAVVEDISSVVWSEKFWLPEGVHWRDFESTDEFRRPQFSDLYYAPIFALLLLCVRYLFEKFIAKPFCTYIGIQNSANVVVESNSICEHVFNSVTKSPHAEQVRGLAKQLGWKEMKVQRWFRKRRAVSQLTLLSKATESCWRCFFYSCLFLLGCCTLLPTTWFYDTKEWFRGGIFKQDFTTSLRVYYAMEMAFYTSLLFSQFLDVKRKDFYQMFLHHIVTLILIQNSFLINYTRIGSVIMTLHDASDVWLEAAKVFNYAKMQRLCDGLFVVFAIVFFFTRWIYFPFWVIHCYYTYSWVLVGPSLAFYHLFGLLCTLQVLHLYWGVLVAKMVYNFTVLGKVEKDNRSEDESDDGPNESTSAVANSNSKKKK